MAKGARERSTVCQFSKWRKTGFLRDFLVRGEDIGKKPISEMVRGDEKPGFCEDI
ncbi:hypothetical protein [Microcoleus sp. T2B6]|uniref:hypothetical protein n=1 Tax=Microcoleus sp. T2B6 TaxID=3055424 RepID=UPI002FCEF03B